jgi:hypothetical protein
LEQEQTMLKTFLAAGAALVALPVIAQTGNPTTNTPVGATTTPNSVATGNQVNTNAQTPVAQGDHTMHNTQTVQTDAMSTTDVASDETSAEIDAEMDSSIATANSSTSGQSTMPASANAGVDPVTGGANGYAGVGGPADTRNYPMCSRTVTDSCMQPRGR